MLVDLKNSGFNEGDTLMVHSSLSKIGNVSGGPDSVLNAFMRVLGPNGNIIMPSFSYQGTMLETALDKNYLFNPGSTIPVTGKISQVFMRRIGTKRSIHPTHSFCAYGPYADEIVSGHLNANTNFGKDTPFDSLLKLKGKVVGIGIGIGPVTFYHSVEDFHPELFEKVYLDNTYQFRLKIDQKHLIEEIKIHHPETHRNRIDKTKEIEDWFTKHLKAKGILHEGKFGSANLWWMDANALYTELLALREKGITIYSIGNKSDE